MSVNSVTLGRLMAGGCGIGGVFLMARGGGMEKGEGGWRKEGRYP